MKFWQAIGRALYVICKPLIMFYLRKSHRTRVILRYGDELVVVKTWLGSGKWGLPGGGLHHNETPMDGALRELHEEIGLKLMPDALRLYSSQELHEPTAGFFYTLFIADLQERALLHHQLLEICEARWIGRTELNATNAEPDLLTALANWSDSGA